MTDLERLQHENTQLNRQVTDVQRRCTELLEEKRRAHIDYAVREFHLKYGHPAPAELTVPDDATIRFRFRLIAEEFLELIEAAVDDTNRQWVDDALRETLRNIIEDAPLDLNLPEFMDATHDLDYVVAGTRVVFGYDGLPGAAEVHRANMSKDPNGPDGKPVKPEGWTPPDIEGVLRAQGWERLESDAGAYIDLITHKHSPKTEQKHTTLDGAVDPLSLSFGVPYSEETAFERRMRELPLELNAEEQTKVDGIFKDWKTPSLGGNGHICSTKACEEEGCEVLHPNACATDPHWDGWKCAKHERSRHASVFPCNVSDAEAFDQKCADADRMGTAAGRLMGILSSRPTFFQEAAHGLRKLAAKYPEMPADGERGEVSRGYYEMLAEQLEKLT